MRKLLWATFGVALISLVFAGCKKDEPTYMVQVAATEGGTVEGQNGEYKEGETVVFTAVPADGYYFSKWNDGIIENPRTITIRNEDLTLTAQFAQMLLLTISASENGSIETDVNGRYAPGSSVTVTAKPDADYYFASWSDGNTENPRTITIDKEITITAQFAQMPLLIISASDNGTIETDVNGRYAPGSSVTVTVKPNADYYFAGWSDGYTDNPRTITIGKEDINLTAYFFTPTVDLGLESGTLWATCNLGVTVPWYYGDYYAWGETETKDAYSWETYEYCKGSKETFTKYCYDAEYGNNGFTDNLTTLESADDAATAILGTGWTIPTYTEWNELGSQCYWVWTENYNNQYNASGYIVYKAKAEVDKGTVVYSGDTPSASYSLSDAHIFLPASGFYSSTRHIYVSLQGIYWSASLDENYPTGAHCCYFDNSSVYPLSGSSRYYGQSVRPVRRK
ncbi:MAG: hypothetical protein IKW77_00140 [Salinivirgaceae bacterium]|nr:hypothetical protein [Salinivirgaceae bacterium]